MLPAKQFVTAAIPCILHTKNFMCQAHVRLSEGRIIRCQDNEMKREETQLEWRQMSWRSKAG